MPTITVFHFDYKKRTLPPGVEVVHFHYGQDEQEFMQRMLLRNVDLVILTDIECDEVRAPCGCYGYDGVCCWHRGSSEDEFATCLCSREIRCSYHAR